MSENALIDIKTGTVYDHYCFIILASATKVHSLHEKIEVKVRRIFLKSSLFYTTGPDDDVHLCHVLSCVAKQT